MKSIVSFQRRGDRLVVTTSKYSLFSSAKAYSLVPNKSTILLDNREYRIAYDGTILANVKGSWREVV